MFKSNCKNISENGYLELLDKKIERDPLKNKNIGKTTSLKLTEEQEVAFMKVKEAIDNNTYKRFLLYGVTGSRKNRSIFTINRRGYK